MGDQELYQKIGQLLVDAGPADAREIIVRAELFSEGDGGSMSLTMLISLVS